MVGVRADVQFVNGAAFHVAEVIARSPPGEPPLGGSLAADLLPDLLPSPPGPPEPVGHTPVSGHCGRRRKARPLVSGGRYSVVQVEAPRQLCSGSDLNRGSIAYRL